MILRKCGTSPKALEQLWNCRNHPQKCRLLLAAAASCCWMLLPVTWTTKIGRGCAPDPAMLKNKVFLLSLRKR